MRILITGASSGLGRALAEQAAAPGALLFIGGRAPARLAETAALVRARGAEAETALVDVRDRAGMAEWITSCGRLDLVVANAGISGGTGGEHEPEAQARNIFEVNVTGVLNTLYPAIALMRSQAPGADGFRGRLCIVASVASFIAAPHAPAYCAAKAAARFMGEAMAPGLRWDGMLMTVACPGYIRTPMTAVNDFPMPGLMDADVAAARILAACRAGRVRVAFPWWLALAARAANLLPPRALGALLARGPAKARLPGEGA
jgi:NAD(P)-dependent dehydrogenase (short-subunit alcohol dehydrogenase family)